MLHSLHSFIAYSAAHRAGLVAAAVGGLFLVLVGRRAARRLARRGGGRVSFGVAAATAGALLATGVSTNTSWRFFGDTLHITNSLERAGMFTVLEAALIACALLARENLRGPLGAVGTPGVLVWVISGFGMVPAFAEGGFVGGMVRTVLGPLAAAVLWHLALGVELRTTRPQHRSTGTVAIVVRQLRERLLARLGMGEQDRDARRIARTRAMERYVRLALTYRSMSTDQAGTRRGKRIAHRMEQLVLATGVGPDDEALHELWAMWAAASNATEFAKTLPAAPWKAPAAVAGTVPEAVPGLVPEPVSDPVSESGLRTVPENTFGNVPENTMRALLSNDPSNVPGNGFSNVARNGLANGLGNDSRNTRPGGAGKGKRPGQSGRRLGRTAKRSGPESLTTQALAAKAQADGISDAGVRQLMGHFNIGHPKAKDVHALLNGLNGEAAS